MGLALTHWSNAARLLPLLEELVARLQVPRARGQKSQARKLGRSKQTKSNKKPTKNPKAKGSKYYNPVYVQLYRMTQTMVNFGWQNLRTKKDRYCILAIPPIVRFKGMF